MFGLKFLAKTIGACMLSCYSTERAAPEVICPKERGNRILFGRDLAGFFLAGSLIRYFVHYARNK